MNKSFVIIAFTLCICMSFTVTAQKPKIVWQKAVGGSGTDIMASVSIAADKSIVVCGSSNSPVSGNKTEPGNGGYDFWVVKMDADGSVIWNKTFGGKKDDIASAIIATSDGGYLVGGTSISERSATKSANSFKRSNDLWVMKLNAAGKKIWDKTYGGFFTDKLTSLAELPSGKYVAGGFSFSDESGNKLKNNLGSENTADYWMLTINSNGSIFNQNTYGGTSDDVLTSVSAAGTTGMYAAGNSYSQKLSNEKAISAYGNNDYWIVKTDLDNNKIFEIDFGANRSEYLTGIQVLSDNSLVAGGYSNSTASFSKTNDFLGITDFWLLKMTANGKKQWDRTIGGKGGDYLVSVQQTKDKGFILGGYSNSDIGNDKTENSKDGFDYWIVKTDRLGRVLWDKTIGGNRDDKLAGAYELDSGRYILAGTSSSGISGDKTSRITGGGTASDFWVVCLSELPQNKKAVNLTAQKLTPAGFEITSNPVTNSLSIIYSAEKNSKVNFSIYTADGKLLQQAAVTAAAGSSSHAFNTGSLANSTYYIVMLSADGTKTSTPFIKQ